MIISAIDPVPWLRVIFFSMRFVKHILAQLVIFFAVGVIMASPIAAASVNHSCCPETFQTGLGASSHDLMVHYSQAMKISHGMIDQSSYDTPSATDKMCDVSCCISVTSSALVTFVAQGATSWQLRPAFYRVVNEIALSAASNLHTPPPRTL